MAAKVVKLTTQMMKKLVQEEAAKLMKGRALTEEKAENESPELDAEAPKEVEADELADTLEKHIDHYKANKVKEAKLVAQLKALRESNARIKAKIASRL